MIELNKIYNEDCLITMSNMDKDLIDIVITSPPYNTSRKGSSLNKACANIRYDDFNDCKTDDEYIDWTINVFKLYDKVLKKDGVILYNLSYSSENTHLVWLVLAEIMKQTNFLIADNIIWKKPSMLSWMQHGLVSMVTVRYLFQMLLIHIEFVQEILVLKLCLTKNSSRIKYNFTNS